MMTLGLRLIALWFLCSILSKCGVMKFFDKFALCVLVCTVLTSCDSGDIEMVYEDEMDGRTVRADVAFSGIEAWPKAYSLVFAAWGADGNVPVSSVVLEKPNEECGRVSAELNSISDNVKFVSISLLSKGRSHLYTFDKTYDFAEGSVDFGLINVAEYDRIQNQVFNAYCIRCHGAGNHAAAGLGLTADLGADALVNVPAKRSEDSKVLVAPENVKESFLVEILENDVVGYNHTDVLPESELIDLIKTWIKTCENN